MDNEYFRFYTEVRTALHTESKVILNELSSVFGDAAPPLLTVQRWSKCFRDGREEVQDKERAGTPIVKTTSENIRQVRDLINNDPYITVDELEAENGLSHGTILRIT